MKDEASEVIEVVEREDATDVKSSAEQVEREDATDVKSSAEQVVSEESSKHGEITDQSDGEGYLSLDEASEADIQAESTTREQNSETAAEIETKSEAVEEENEDTKDIEHTEKEETSSALAKRFPVKPPRKVSFVGPDGKKLESLDDGDSPTEHVAETGDDSEEETVNAEDDPSDEETITADGPSELPNEVSEIVVVMSEDADCSESLPEGDDDDLTEVSSMSSSQLASSDAPDTISTSHTSRLLVLTDTDDTGSRITLILEDNQAAICMAKNPQFHGRAKHIDIKYHFVREQVAKDTVKLEYCRSEETIADIFTKGLSQAQFTKLRNMAGITSIDNK